MARLPFPIFIVLILTSTLSSVEAGADEPSGKKPPAYIEIPITPGRPSRPPRPGRSADMNADGLSTGRISDASGRIANVPWAGTESVRCLRVDRRGNLQLVGNIRIRLAEVSIPKPSRLSGMEGETGRITVDMVRGLVHNATVVIDLAEDAKPGEDAWAGYIHTASGVFLNEHLLYWGWARHADPAEREVYTESLIEAEKDARRNRRGLWAQEP